MHPRHERPSRPARWSLAGAALLLLLAGSAARGGGERETAVIPAGVVALEKARTAADRLEGPVRRPPDLGIRFGSPRLDGVAIQRLDRGGPAARAGLLPGDVVVSIGRVHTREIEDVERAMAFARIGELVRLRVRREPVKRDVRIEYREGDTPGEPGFAYARRKGRFLVTRVERGSPADRAGLSAGDTFLRIDRALMQSSSQVRRKIARKRAFTVRVDRPGAQLTPELEPVAAPEEVVLEWKDKTFDLAVLLVEFADVRHNPVYTAADFERMMFSEGEYTEAPDGRRTHGSVRDYYREVSVGRFDLRGKVFDWVRVPEKWEYYDRQGMGAGDGGSHTIFHDALQAARQRFGAGALDPYQGVVFVYAGERRSYRGSQLWPHRASVRVGGEMRPYYIVEEGGEAFTSIGVHCHEFGHMLGLPDFYGYGHRTGVGRFCVMAIGHQGAPPSKSDRPFHMCAWCKIRLGWLEPTVIHPGDQQHLALRPVQGSTTEALKILVSPSGDEYFLLEVRARKGFDGDFFAEGLLIWHVGEDGQRAAGQISVAIDLEEAHGVRYFDASLREEREVVFPSRNTDAFTPDTFPSSASNLQSAFEVVLTDMRVYKPDGASADPSIPDGTVFFRVGDRQRAAGLRPVEPQQPVYPVGEPVEELDPVTELPVPFTIGDGNVALPGPNIMPRGEREEGEKGRRGREKREAEKGRGGQARGSRRR